MSHVKGEKSMPPYKERSSPPLITYHTTGIIKSPPPPRPPRILKHWFGPTLEAMYMHGRIQGGVLGVTGPPPPPHTHTHTHSTAIYKCRSTRISFRLGELRSVKMANSFWGGGGREGAVRGSRNFRGSSASFKLSTTKDS